MNKTFGYLIIAVGLFLGSLYFSEAACTPLGTVTPLFGLCKPAVGEVGWGSVVNANMDTIDSNLTNSLPRSYLAGLGTSNNAAATTTKVDIAAGQAQDAGNAGGLILSASTTKDLSAVWAVGSGNGCLGTAVARTASTWYHLFVIKRTDTNVVDAYCDTSISAANIPSPYTLFRRIGSIKTDASQNILAFSQNGDYFRLKASVLDVSLTNPGTALILATLTSVPTGVQVKALVNLGAFSGSSAPLTYVHDLSANDEAVPVVATTPQVPGASMWVTSASAITGWAQVEIMTDTTQHIGARLAASGANDRLGIVTLGWTDYRGRNN